MCKIYSLFLLAALLACNNGPNKTRESKTAADTAGQTTATKYTWQETEEQEFLSGCVDSAKIKVNEATAFAQCKCILTQLKQRFPSMDSASPALMDVKYVAQLAANCK